MKSLIFSFAVILTTYNIGFTQTNIYHQFPDSGAVWNMNYYNYCFGPTTQENYSIEISGDTTINTLVYHKLNIPFVQVLSSSCGLNTIVGYKGAFREDTNTRMVYIIPPSTNTEQLWFDFTMQVGDTVQGYIGQTFSGLPEIVQSIDSVLVGGNYHKRWLLNPWYNCYLIEGVGSTYGMISPLPGYNITDQPDRSITCFSVNGVSLFPVNSSLCNLITSNYLEELITQHVEFSPNPFSDELIIHSNINLVNASFILFNARGEEVSRLDNCSGQFIHFKRNVLPNGIYYFQLLQSDNLVVGHSVLIIN